ncbi:hypothetical protein EB118_13875 [bacterium]|nr:hypothetical protein [bacterium]
MRSDGYLFAWGLGTSGQLGDGTAISKSSPSSYKCWWYFVCMGKE